MSNQTKTFPDLPVSPDETLLWSGQPRQGIFFTASDALTIPFALILCEMARETGIINGDAPLWFSLWAIPFFCFGLYILVGRFFADAKQRGKTHYGVTNRRVIIVSDASGEQVKSLNLKTLTGVSLDEKSDRSGTITFDSTDSKSGWKRYVYLRQNEPFVPSFDSIQNAKAVCEIIRNAQKSAA